MELEEKYKSKIISLLSAIFPDTKIYLYGSRARRDHYSTPTTTAAPHTKVLEAEAD